MSSASGASPRHNLAELLAKTATFFESRGIGSARLDAELLLGEVLGLDRLHLYTSFDRPMSDAELDSYRTLVKRRAKREPVAYILGHREFYGRDFVVDKRVLIPRPDTEVLIDEVLTRLPDDASGVVVDYGTGSGAIGLTLAAERPGLSVLGLDISEDALNVARANADHLGLRDRVGFVRSDGLSALPPRFLNKIVALVANPPYVPEEDHEGLMPEVRDHEPQSALFAGPDPLLHYRRLALEAPSWMHPDAFISVEVGAGQSAAVSALFDDAGWADLSVRSDLGRHERVVSASAPPNGQS